MYPAKQRVALLLPRVVLCCVLCPLKTPPLQCSLLSVQVLLLGMLETSQDLVPSQLSASALYGIKHLLSLLRYG